MAQQAGIPASTLRYYDKEGLLPFVERTPGGIRIFQDRDMEWLRVIGCLKRAGMPLEDIRRYIQPAMEGDGTIGERLELFRKQRELLRARMVELSGHSGRVGVQMLVLRDRPGRRNCGGSPEPGSGAGAGTSPGDSPETPGCAGEMTEKDPRLGKRIPGAGFAYFFLASRISFR